MKRGAIRKTDSELVTFWVPKNVHAAMNQAIELEDSDRSKFVRNAVREKLTRMGLPVGVPVGQQAR